MISIQQLSGMFDEKHEFIKPINIEAEKLLLDSFDSLIKFIEDIKWKSFAGSDKFEIYPAVGTVVPRIFKLLHVSYELFKRGYEGMSYSLLRTTLDHQDLLHLFFREEKWAKLWYSDDNITSARGDLSPRKVRDLLGKKKVEDWFGLFSKYVHPTSRDAHDSFFALVEEDGELKAARLDVQQPVKSLHINLGGTHAEGNEWLMMMFINTLLCRLLHQLDVHLSEFVNAESADEPFKAIEKLNHFLKGSASNALQGLMDDPEQVKLACAGILAGSLGDEIIQKMLNDDPVRIKKLEKVLGLS